MPRDGTKGKRGRTYLLKDFLLLDKNCRIDVADENQDGHDGVDSISDLPDAIHQTILSSLPTKLAIRTSVLSKRWKHVWCYAPCLKFGWCESRLSADSINETLAHYKAEKMMSFHLSLNVDKNYPYIESWIEFAKSRNVENLTLEIGYRASARYTSPPSYTMPDSFYINSFVKKLSLCLKSYDKMILNSSVSWPSLKKLFLRECNLPEESTLYKILSGCPVLESLTLDMCRCRNLKVFDLSKSPRLRTLEIFGDFWEPHIVAPHIHCLSLTIPPNSQCNLVDVSSLTEARIDFGDYVEPNVYGGFRRGKIFFYAGFLEHIVQNILEKLHNVEKLTFGETSLKVLSLTELRGVPLPLFKCKALTFETMISQLVIPGIVKLLQSLHELEKLTVHIKYGRIIQDLYFDSYLSRHGLERSRKCWSLEARSFKNTNRKNVESTHVASLMEIMLKSTKTLEKMVVNLGSCLEERRVKELVKKVPLLSQNNNNVSIMLSAITKSDQRFTYL